MSTNNITIINNDNFKTLADEAKELKEKITQGNVTENDKARFEDLKKMFKHYFIQQDLSIQNKLKNLILVVLAVSILILLMYIF